MEADVYVSSQPKAETCQIGRDEQQSSERLSYAYSPISGGGGRREESNVMSI